MKKAKAQKPIIKANKSHQLYPHIFVKDGYICTPSKEKDTPPRRIAKAIMIDRVNTDIDTGEITYDLSFDFQGKPKIAALARGDLTKTKLLRLASLGCDIFDHNVKEVIMHLNNEEKTAPESNVHQWLGWGTYLDKPIFKHFRAVGTDSSYVGDKSIEPKGTLEKWIGMVNKEVIGHIPLEAALVFGLSSVIVGFINEELAFGCLFIHLAGDSTSGKTTACQLSISTAGYPDTKKNGLATTWNSTNNAIMGVLRNNNGLPVLFDEASMSNNTDYTKIIYTFANGREKHRMSKELALIEAASWNTTIESNGEYGMTSKSKKNVGIDMRLSQFLGVSWTTSAQNAESIKETILENYGHAAPLFAEHVLKLGKIEVLNTHKKWKEKFLEALSDCNHFASRIATKMAIIMTTADLAAESLQLNLNLEGLFTFLVENELQSTDDRDISGKAYSYLLEQVSINHHKFSSDFGNLSKGIDFETVKFEQWGKIDYKKGMKEINIIPTILKKLLTDGGFEEPTIILKKWKEQGILNHEKDRHTRKRQVTINGPTIDVYVINVREEIPDCKLRVVKKKKPLVKNDCFADLDL